MINNLIWSPIYAELEKKLKLQKGVILIICPFIQTDALNKIIEYCPNLEDLKIITRWNKEDLVSGVSDIKIYNLLNSKGAKLYINQHIHLKLFIFPDNTVFTTSANVTNQGLGLSNNNNVETGCFLQLNRSDYVQIETLIEHSKEVTSEIFNICENYIKVNKDNQGSLPPLILPERKSFSINSLPNIETPQALYELYKRDSKNQNHEISIKYNGDLNKYKIKENLDENLFFSTLSNAFLTQNLILEFIEYLKINRICYFGEAVEWFHNKCSDKPVPYRVTVKDKVKNVLSW